MQIRNWISFAGTSSNSPARFRATSTPTPPEQARDFVAGSRDGGKAVGVYLPPAVQFWVIWCVCACVFLCAYVSVFESYLFRTDIIPVYMTRADINESRFSVTNAV